MGNAIVYGLLEMAGMLFVNLILLRMTTRFILRYDMTFKEAGLIAVPVSFLSGLIYGAVSVGMWHFGCTKLLSTIVAAILQFAATSAVLGATIKTPDRKQFVGFGKGFVINLVMQVSGFIIFLLVNVAVWWVCLRK